MISSNFLWYPYRSVVYSMLNRLMSLTLNNRCNNTAVLRFLEKRNAEARTNSLQAVVLSQEEIIRSQGDWEAKYAQPNFADGDSIARSRDAVKAAKCKWFGILYTFHIYTVIDRFSRRNWKRLQSIWRRRIRRSECWKRRSIDNQTNVSDCDRTRLRLIPTSNVCNWNFKKRQLMLR